VEADDKLSERGKWLVDTIWKKWKVIRGGSVILLCGKGGQEGDRHRKKAGLKGGNVRSCEFRGDGEAVRRREKSLDQWESRRKSRNRSRRGGGGGAAFSNAARRLKMGRRNDVENIVIKNSVGRVADIHGRGEIVEK